MRLLSYLGIALVAAWRVHALIRFGCSQLVTERFDPLVTPGYVSPHLHQIVGGNAFNLTMNPKNDLPEISTCTTCRFKEDKSNYWTAVLYFKHQNGSYIRVNQMANHNTGPGLQSGGMTIYYFQTAQNLTIFPKGFRMTVGNATRRANDINPNIAASRATSFRCFQGAEDMASDQVPGWGEADSFSFPKIPCNGGIRSNIYFPQCWDGVNLDSADHQSHVAHPIGDPTTGLGFFGTPCPDSHPVRLPLLFMEIIWDTRPFNDLWPTDGSQPLVFSMGDPNGFGQHADYVFGWEGDSLKKAMDTCTGGTGIPWDCPVLSLQDVETMNQCRQGEKVPEVVEGQYIDKLPGCNPIQVGPNPATLVPNCNAASTTTAAPAPTASPLVVSPPWTVCNPASNPNTIAINPNCVDYPGPTSAQIPPSTAPPNQITGVPL
ncbi:hypothetical protein CPB83DRAFT_863689 [Crepidotus variabilis]|uniref:DUF1996 domain-containing protein n=1 Tax=Crepidotus variabilis TaxID=179855 RepID=A0A9P6JJD6_9AGAR|nr:hypothetical protein CPB83DRAFT_863689 [Crepidotus variabilis]